MTHPKFARHKQAGFTLVEIILYVGLFGLIVTGLFGAAYPLLSSSDKNTASVVAEGEAAFVLQKISWALSNASAVTSPAGSPEPGGSGSTLAVNRTGGPSVTFSNPADEIQLQEGANPAETLNGSRAKVQNFLVRHVVPPSPDKSYVEISFDVNGRHVGPVRHYFFF